MPKEKGPHEVVEDWVVMPDAERTQMDRKHIFAVNGSPEFLDFLRQLLQEEQYNVTTTNFVPRTFDQIAALAPDLLIIDVAIGHEAGWDLLERPQRGAATHGIPVIVTSVDPSLLDRARQQADRYGGQRFVPKPMDVDELLSAIQSLIGAAD